ncbi:hypothetical protein STEG23_001497 [Scotinomys teguina]
MPWRASRSTKVHPILGVLELASRTPEKNRALHGEHCFFTSAFCLQDILVLLKSLGWESMPVPALSYNLKGSDSIKGGHNRSEQLVFKNETSPFALYCQEMAITNLIAEEHMDRHRSRQPPLSADQIFI